MSMDAYRVAVKVSLVENVTRGLALMARHFRTTDLEAKALESRLKSIGKLAMFGGMVATAGAFGLGMFKKPIDEAIEYERKLGSLRQMGLGDAQIADARKFVEATNIIGTSVQDRMRIFTDAQGSFRESGMAGPKALMAAKSMLPVLATYEVATGMLAGPQHDAAEGSMRNLNKIIEMMGGLNDTNRARAIADGVFKAAQSSGRMVDERQLKQFVAYGSSATNQLSLRTIFGGLEPIIGEMGGSTTGVGLRTAYNRVNGMMALTPRRTREELARLGMADASGRRQTDGLARLQATDTIAYTQEIMKRYQAAGITSRVDMERENAILFGTNGAKIMNKIMSQMPVILKSIDAYDKAHGAGAVTTDPNNKALIAMQNLQAKEADLKLRIGQVIMPIYIKGLQLIAGALEKVKSLPAPVFKGLVMLFGALSAVALVGGGIALVTAGFQALAIIGPALTVVGGAFSFIATVMPLIGSGFMVLGRALMLNPIGLAITAIAAAVYLLWKNWDWIGPKLAAMWNGIKEAFLTGINFIIGLVNHLPGVNISPIGGGTDNPPSVRPRPNPGQSHGVIIMDGKKVGKVVTFHQINDLGRPNRGTSFFNPTMARPAVAGGR